VGNDICVANIGAAANTVRQFTLDHTDFAGAFTRNLVSATSRLRMVGGFENNRLLPDNSWLLFRAEWLNYNREEMWMAKMPPYPTSDSIDRGTFVPMVLNLQPPAGVKASTMRLSNSAIREYSGNCTSRRDPMPGELRYDRRAALPVRQRESRMECPVLHRMHDRHSGDFAAGTLLSGAIPG
jgi:hypothetical protein